MPEKPQPPEMPMYQKTLAQAQATGSVEVSALPRRAFIWKLGSVPLAACALLEGKVVSAVTPKFEANSRYILFADARAVNLDHLQDLIPGAPPLPDNCFIEIVALKLQSDQTIDDAIRLYQVSDARP